MSKSVEHFSTDLTSIRTGRANPALIDRVMVPYYGTPTPLNQLAQISAPEARLLVVQVYDKSQIGAIEKALRSGDQSLNPASDGQVIRVPIPPLTEERRRDLAKLASRYAEQQRIAVRNVRREANDDLKKAEKDGAISQDELKRMSDEVQKLTDEAVKRVDEALKTKEHEIMQV
ncbi:MAG TPA: ribosome recycling factor [Caulobacteraceae bacterium]